MTAHERLRQLHAEVAKPDSEKHFDSGPLCYEDEEVGMTLIDALPQLANLAEAAEALAYAADNTYIPEGCPHDENLYDAERRCTIALHDLVEALNPTRNTQSPT